MVYSLIQKIEYSVLKNKKNVPGNLPEYSMTCILITKQALCMGVIILTDLEKLDPF